jgi:glycosyltransferase involved in cell wall biosynthesis
LRQSSVHEPSSPIKLLHILPSFGPGGHRARIALLAVGLGPGFTHRVVALDDGAGAHPIPAGIDLVGFRIVPSAGIRPANLWRLRLLLARECPDVLITYNWGAIEAALVNRISWKAPHLHCEDGFSGAAALRGEPLRRALFRRLVLRDSMLAVPSQVLVETARRRWRIQEERIALVRNGIDVERFAAAAAGRSRPADEVTVGMLSRLSAEKNIGLLLHAFSHVAASSPAKLAIAGDGPERRSLEALAARLGLADRVRFMGHVRDPAAFLRSVDVFAISSVTEQLPFSLIEAMAAGLPVVATDVGDIREAVAPANRKLLARSGDDAALAQALRGLLISAELRRSIGNANAERAREAFDQRNMIAAYRRLLLMICSRGSPENGTA